MVVVCWLELPGVFELHYIDVRVPYLESMITHLAASFWKVPSVLLCSIQKGTEYCCSCKIVREYHIACYLVSQSSIIYLYLFIIIFFGGEKKTRRIHYRLSEYLHWQVSVCKRHFKQEFFVKFSDIQLPSS
jgi:hypothetical protein